MSKRLRSLSAAVVFAASIAVLPSVASAAPVAIKNAAASAARDRRYRHRAYTFT
jgi:hypothetical protein